MNEKTGRTQAMLDAVRAEVMAGKTVLVVAASTRHVDQLVQRCWQWSWKELGVQRAVFDRIAGAIRYSNGGLIRFITPAQIERVRGHQFDRLSADHYVTESAAMSLEDWETLVAHCQRRPGP